MLLKLINMKRFISKSVTLFTFLVISIFSFNSCTKNTYDKLASFQMDPTFNIGLISGTVGFNNLNNILSDSNSSLQIGSDSSITFYWKGNISNFTTKDFIPAFNSDTVSFTLDAPSKNILDNAIARPTPYIISDSQTVKITPERAQTIDIDTLVLKSGTVQVTINNTFNEPCTIEISVPGIKQTDGTLLTKTITVKSKSITIDTFNISGRIIDMTNGGTTANNLLLKYKISLTKSSGGPEPNGNLTFTQQINHPDMKMMWADVHQQNFFTANVADIPLNAFKLTQNGLNPITLSDPQINLYFENSFGVPMKFTFASLKGKDASGKSCILNVDGIQYNTDPQIRYFKIDSALFASSGSNYTVTPSHDSLKLNKNNPGHNSANGNLSLPEFLSAMPSSILPQFQAISNPSKLNGNHNFIQDISKGSIDAQIIIPLRLSIDSFITKDTFDFSLGDMTNVDSLTLRFAVNNGMPLSLGATLAFVDATQKPYKVIYTKNIPTLLSPAQIDPITFKVIKKTLTTTDFTLGSTVMPNIKNVNKLIFTGIISSPTSSTGTKQPAVMYSNQSIDINIGAKAHYKIN